MIGFRIARPLIASVCAAAVVEVAQAQPQTQALPGDSATVLRPCSQDHPVPPSGSSRCFESKSAWFFTDDTMWARRAIATTEIAAARFERVFGKQVPRGMVIHKPVTQFSSTMVIMEQTNPTAGTATAAWTWLWTEPPVLGALGSGVQTHEMGHLWLIKTFPWPTAAGFTSQYGAAGADWLDETAAILMEDSVYRVQRRGNLMRNYRANPRDTSLIKPLATLFTMAHPTNIASIRMTTADTAGITDSIASGLARGDSIQGVLARIFGEQTKQMADEVMKSVAANPLGVSGFYDQCQVFIDFLVERTKDPTIFGAIAANEASGSNVAAWLQTNGARYNLPTTVEELETEWRAWLAAWVAKGDVSAPPP